MKHLHISGICGTFMGGVALLARELGFNVTGSDANVYPPMSTQLEQAGITLMQGYSADNLVPEPDLVVIGNALSRGNPEVEAILNRGIAYTSGAQWLSENLLQDRWVLAAAGTHGKTSTSSLLAWILEYAGLAPGFLIGGVPANFGESARLGRTPFFVVEADEYDTAFFDKRSKFVHYAPRTAILNNLEFDHADIFDDLAAIKRQFHHLVRTIPGQGLIIANDDDQNVHDVLSMGCWSETEYYTCKSDTGKAWQCQAAIIAGARALRLVSPQGEEYIAQWDGLGVHSQYNAVAALLAARHAGVPINVGMQALSTFEGVKRRMQLIGQYGGVFVYDDFAHHPTAIKTTLEGLRSAINPDDKIHAVLELRSNTMRMGAHLAMLPDALKSADSIYLYQPENLACDLRSIKEALPSKVSILSTVDGIVDSVTGQVGNADHILIMSNGSFDGLHGKVNTRLADI